MTLADDLFSNIACTSAKSTTNSAPATTGSTIGSITSYIQLITASLKIFVIKSFNHACSFSVADTTVFPPLSVAISTLPHSFRLVPIRLLKWQASRQSCPVAGKMQITAFFFVAKKLLRVRSCTQQNKFVWFVFPSEKIGATGREQSEELNAIKCLVL